MQIQPEALAVLTRSWRTIVEECRSVLGSELHYQALVYHCLRKVGQVPPTQIGMNVKMWIPDVVSEYFKVLDLKRAKDFRGGFEPIPDEVRHRESDFLPVAMVVDTAPEPVERMTGEAVDGLRSAAGELGVGFFYLSGEEKFCAIPEMS